MDSGGVSDPFVQIRYRGLEAGPYTRSQFSAQRKHVMWDRGRIQGLFRGYLGGVRG